MEDQAIRPREPLPPPTLFGLPIVESDELTALDAASRPMQIAPAVFVGFTPPTPLSSETPDDGT